MKILVTGTTGLIGSALLPRLRAQEHSVIDLKRAEVIARGLGTWNPATGEIDPDALSGVQAVVHLAGANIGDKRWTKARKNLIYSSRVGPTHALAQTLAGMPAPPDVLVVASAIGFYGDRDDEWLDESSAPGQGFLAELVHAWEGATAPAAEKGIRVVNLRFGIILTPKGGALKRMLLPFKLGLGGVMGSGRQYWSWVGIDDVIGTIEHAISNPTLSGPVNVVAPNPVSNRDFTATLARVLNRPAIFPLPAFVLRMALGEMAEELLLSSAHVRPNKLMVSGYQFEGTDLGTTLRHLLNR